MVKHNIKSKKVHREIRFLGLTSPVKMLKLRLDAEKSFVDNLLHLLPDIISSFTINFTLGRGNKFSFEDIF